MKKIDIIIITTVCLVIVGGAITALVVINQPPPRPTAIEIRTNPTRVDYARGERIDTTGMVIWAIFPDGTTNSFTRGFRLDTKTATNGGVFDNPTPATQTVKVTFRGRTDTFTINVSQAKVRSMHRVSVPTKWEYTVGSPLDWTGFRARLVWTDTARNEVIQHNHPGLTFTMMNAEGVPVPVNTSTPGRIWVTARYAGFDNVVFDITVRA